MRRKNVGIAASVIGAALIGFAVVSCNDDSTGPANNRYVANLNAAAEAGNFTSPGSGVVEFLDLGSEITWTMNLTNMTAVTQSHIHLGDATAVAPPAGTGAGPVIIRFT